MAGTRPADVVGLGYPLVVGIAAQPFWLSWTGPGGKDVAKFEATRRACELLGWEYRLVGAPDLIATANLRWLAGYRHPRQYLRGLAEALQSVFAKPAPLLAAAEAVGDPIAVLPVLFHLLWRQDLATDLSVPLHPFTTVATAGIGLVAA